MRIRLKNIIDLLRYLIFIFLVYTIDIPSATELYKIINHDFYELTDFNGDDDKNEEEKQEEDSKNEKIEFHAINYSYHYYPNNQESSSYINLKTPWNFSLEIPIPPPERILISIQ